MKILLSAYACEPGRGSEAEAGLRALVAAASVHDVWVLTRSNNVAPLRRYVDSNRGPSRHVEIIGIDLHDWSQAIKRLSKPLLHLYYERWQRRAARVAADLDAKVGFDVVHHSTFATHWSRVGVAALAKPLVIGPVGGASITPRPLLRELGVRGAVDDGVRFLVRALGARRSVVERAYRSAAVVLVQNDATAAVVQTRRSTVRHLPNALSVDVAEVFPLNPGLARGREVAFVGNLIPLKGGRLAVEAFAEVVSRDATLTFYGDGPERARIEHASRRLGLESRVRFAGRITRSELLRQVAVAGVLIHSALHDESPFAVAEALALGTPVVCLDAGGPAEVARHWPHEAWKAVAPGKVGLVARELAGAIDAFLAAPPPVAAAPRQPVTGFDEAILRAYRDATQVV